REQSAPLLVALEAWLREQRSRLPRASSVAEPIDYMLRRWDRHPPLSTAFLFSFACEIACPFICKLMGTHDDCGGSNGS
ncbi:MAG: hypothetical protein WAL40_00950, partial [Rhodoplanes sp.]